VFAEVSARDVSSTNFVPERTRHISCSENNPLRRNRGVRTGGGKKDRHLERLRLDDLRTRARARRGEPACDGMYAMQRARKNKVFVGGELRETI
jgi:hypothetical protein